MHTSTITLYLFLFSALRLRYFQKRILKYRIRALRFPFFLNKTLSNCGFHVYFCIQCIKFPFEFRMAYL